MMFPCLIHVPQEQFREDMLDALELYDECSQRLEKLSDLDEKIGATILDALNKLSKKLDELSKTFGNDAESLGLFESPSDINAIMELLYMDNLIGVGTKILDSVDNIMDNLHKMRKEKKLNKEKTKKKSGTGKSRPNIPYVARSCLSKWFQEHVEQPYPKPIEKLELSKVTGLSVKKVENWFINERSRKWNLYPRKSIH